MKSKSPVFFLLIIVFIILFGNKSVASQEDTLKGHRIIIAPFQPEYYLSDAEQDIMQQTRKTPDEYRAYFRRVLDLKIEAALSTVVPCISLLQDTSKQVREDLMRYYAIAEMKYEFPIASKDKRSQRNKNEATSQEIKDQHQAPIYATTKGDLKFMNSSVSDTAFYKSFLSKYNADYLLSINQFEIKTNYKSCIDIANRIYHRELMIHYSLLDSKGKVVQGTIAMDFFPSNSNRDSDIAERTFPKLAEQIKLKVMERLSK